MAKHHQNQIFFAWGNLAVLGPEVGSWSYSRRREEHLVGGECGGGVGGASPSQFFPRRQFGAVFLKGVSGDLQVAD